AHRHLSDDHHFLRARPSQSKVDADCREDESDETAVHFGGIFADEVLVLDELQNRDEDAANGSVECDLFDHRGEKSTADQRSADAKSVHSFTNARSASGWSYTALSGTVHP